MKQVDSEEIVYGVSPRSAILMDELSTPPAFITEAKPEADLVIVTSFNSNLWNAYAKDTMASWLKHIKGNYELLITVDGVIPEGLPHGDNVTLLSLDNEPRYLNFLRGTKGVHPPPNVPPEHQFRFEFRRFWPKVWSLYEATSFDDKHVLWLDADVMIHKDVHVDQIIRDLYHDQEGFDTRCYTSHLYDFVTLDRGQPWGYMDSGYFLSHTKSLTSLVRLATYLVNLYETGTIFRMQEWHDAWLISQLLQIMYGSFLDESGNYRFNIKSLSGYGDHLNPMEATWLKDYMIHFKGNRKANLQ